MGQIFVKASRRAKAYSRKGPNKGNRVDRLEKLFRKAHKVDQQASQNWIKKNPGLYGKPGLIDKRTDFSKRQNQLSRRVEALRDGLNNARVGRGLQPGQMKFIGGRHSRFR